MSSKTFEKPVFEMPAVPMAANIQKTLLSWAHLQAHAFKAMMRYQIEAVSFLQHRYQQDAKLADDLIASKEIGDTFNVCSDFMRCAAAEYGAETERLASISARIASEAADETRKQAETLVGDIAVRKAA